MPAAHPARSLSSRCGSCFLKRWATLLGLNPPTGHAVAIVRHPPVDQPSSFDRIRAALDRLMEEKKPDSVHSPDALEPPKANGGEEDKLN